MSKGHSIVYRTEGEGLPIAVDVCTKTVGHIHQSDRGWRFTSSVTNQSGCMFDSYSDLVAALELEL